MEKTEKTEEGKTGRGGRFCRAAAAAVLMTAAVLMAGVQAGCGAEAPKTEAASENQISGTVVDAGQISALCPKGWESVGVPDLSAKSADTLETGALRFVKGGTDQDHNAFIELRLYDSEKDIPRIDASRCYDNVTGTGNINTGSYIWSGYSGLSLGKPFVYLETAGEREAFTAYLYTQEGNPGSASVSDAEVQAILNSVQRSKE